MPLKNLLLVEQKYKKKLFLSKELSKAQTKNNTAYCQKTFIFQKPKSSKVHTYASKAQHDGTKRSAADFECKTKDSKYKKRNFRQVGYFMFVSVYLCLKINNSSECCECQCLLHNNSTASKNHWCMETWRCKNCLLTLLNSS